MLMNTKDIGVALVGCVVGVDTQVDTNVVSLRITGIDDVVLRFYVSDEAAEMCRKFLGRNVSMPLRVWLRPVEMFATLPLAHPEAR